MKKIKSWILSLVAMWLAFSASGQGEVAMADTMRSEGKIYVVVVMVLVILIGLISYLIIMDRKVKRLEKHLQEKR